VLVSARRLGVLVSARPSPRSLPPPPFSTGSPGPRNGGGRSDTDLDHLARSDHRLTALVSGPDPDPPNRTVPVTTPAFPDRIPLTRTAPLQDLKIAEDVAAILASGVLTNGLYVRELERRAADFLGVAECVAVSSCTTGLMLVVRAAGLACEVVVPGFGFGAVARAAVWNGLQVSYADIDPHTLTLAAQDAADAIGIRTSALLAVHSFGNPCDVDALAELAERSGIALLFDAAEALGSRRLGVPLGGSGDAEVFSLSSTSMLTGCEGGLIAINDPELAKRCRIGRDESPSDYDNHFLGLDARLSEIHAAVALASMETIEERVDAANLVAADYRRLLDGIEGIDLPGVRDGDRGNGNGFTVLVDPDRFGMSAADLAAHLATEGIETRRYGGAVAAPGRATLRRARTLPVASAVASRALTLPLWPELTEEQLGRVVETIVDARASLGGGEAAFASA
jgi:dTDP-4-amino-4,6-dideoxygalactose transaminase